MLSCGTREQPEGLRLAPVGLGFLLTVTLGALQTRLVGDSGNTGYLTSVFRDHTSQFQCLTCSKPVKQLFTEINAPETDLDALRHIPNCQVETLRNTRTVLDPRSFEYARIACADPFDVQFLTSFMGMNTADIRDMDSRSGIFFAIAVKFTACVVGLGLLYGYNLDVIMEYTAQLCTARPPRRLVPSHFVLGRQGD
ncbi:hypothetical protein DL766_002535 [Monosporascus sp. MC13-8B]|uniref:Uncharacterized protein n=1 Tax=Monosporascus cannonballus TaxID=155416 RepID=A0ABY0GVR2_9PEZI|nr:hypothetical protein DL762_009986 [Monosporascus cannonballus]RYP01039.1 hypothetical protein DL763_000460 [Monosporascus cannonballus]RYP35359.1 hypothetical protein DL766_002535 [Monosporascus sp. MC13-8B]